MELAPKVPFESGLKPRMLEIIDSLAAEGSKCFLLPVGGSTPLGAWGYIEAFDEMMQQGLAENFDDVVVACGSGGTAAGLAIANFLLGSPVRMHGICVCDDQNYFYKHIDETLVALGVATTAREIIRIVDGYKGHHIQPPSVGLTHTCRQGLCAVVAKRDRLH